MNDQQETKTYRRKVSVMRVERGARAIANHQKARESPPIHWIYFNGAARAALEADAEVIEAEELPNGDVFTVAIDCNQKKFLRFTKEQFNAEWEEVCQ